MLILFVILAYLVMGVINCFLWTLFITLSGEYIDVEDGEYICYMALLFVFTVFTLPVIIIIFCCKYILKFTVYLSEKVVEAIDEKNEND